MDIGLREWLIIIGIIVIAGILFDGWRRMRGKGKLKFRLDRTLSNHDDDAPDSAEVLGPPRVVKHAEPVFGDEEDAAPAEVAKPKSARTRREEPRQGDLLGLDEPDALLLDDDEGVSRRKPKRDDKPKRDERKGRREKNAEPEVSPSNELLPLEEVLVINVISRDTLGFKGPALLQNILESGLRFGDMNIFHRHESMAGNGEVLFSMANAVKPGTFDLDDIDRFTTPAVSFFLGLPGPRHPKQAFDVMLAAARKLASELGGELKDEQRSVMTAQTIEHYRSRIVEFERRSLTLKR